MMRHECVDGFKTCTIARPIGREVQRFPKPVEPIGTHLGQPAKVLGCLYGRHRQCKGRGIGRHDHVAGETAPQAQAADAERLVAKAEFRIARRIGRFRNSPGKAVLRAILPLHFHRHALAFAQQRFRSAAQ